jgi:hypothetical protein
MFNDPFLGGLDWEGFFEAFWLLELRESRGFSKASKKPQTLKTATKSLVHTPKSFILIKMCKIFQIC